MRTRLFLALLCVMCAVTSVRAAVVTWSRYNLSFEVPDGGVVTYNSNTRFEVQWDEMVMTVQLYAKDKTTEKEITTNLDRKALGFNMYDTKHGKIKVKGFKGLIIDGTMPDGTRALIADLISKKQNLIVEVTINYLLGNREMVDDMIKSFAENNNQQPNREKHKQKVQTPEAARQQELQRKQQEQQKQQEEQRRRAHSGRLYDA